MSAPEVSSLSLLLFSAGGVNFGIDSEQMSGMKAYDGESGENLFWFHQLLDFGTVELTYHFPTILSLRTVRVVPYRVVIDAIEDIAEFSRNDIHPFPALLEPFALQNGLWGILPRNGKMVLLVDMELVGKRC